MPDTPSRKQELRERAMASRAALGNPARAAASAAIRRRLRELPAVAAASTVLGYAAFGDEVDIDPLLDDLLRAGAKVCMPYVEGKDLECAAVDRIDDLAPGFRGVREPPAAIRRPADPSRVDVALVPGVAFDRRGGRLGYGGGHFDRLLGRLGPGATVVGVAYVAQVLDAVPVEPHDRRVDLVMTEEGNLRATD